MMKDNLISLMNTLVYPCKDVTSLLVQQEDQDIALATRLRIRGHILMCKGCGRFEGQIQTMRNSLKAWRNYEDM